MGNLIRTVGNGTNGMYPAIKRSVGLLSDGSVVMLVVDNNQTGVTGDGGDNTGIPKLHIYHSTDRTSWTLKNTINLPGATSTTAASFVVDSANNLHVAYRGSTNTTILYAKGTYSAGPTWAFGASVSVATSLTGYNNLSIVDIDTIGNSTECVVIGAFWYQNTGSTKTAFNSYIRTTGGSWVAHTPELLLTNELQLGYTDDISVSGDNLTAIGGDNVGIFAYHATRRSSSTDLGDVLKVVRVNCSTGAKIASHTIASGVWNGWGGGFRKYWLFNRAANQFDMVGVVDANGFRVGAYGFTWDRGTNTHTDRCPFSSSVPRGINLVRGTNNHNWCGVAATGWMGRYLVFGTANMSITAGIVIDSGIASLGSTYDRYDNGYGYPNGTYDASGQYTSPTVAPAEQIWSGATRNWATNRLDMMVYHHRYSGTGVQSYRIESVSLNVPLAPTGVQPVASQTVTTDRPTLAANHKLAQYHAQLRTKMRWQLASDAGFTTNSRMIVEPDSDFIQANATSSPYNAVVTSTQNVDQLTELTQGTWYIRALTEDWARNLSAWSGSHTFVVTHPPVGADLYPTSGAVFLYAGLGEVTFSWRFTDPSPYDSQTAYQITVEDEAGAVIADSGKVASSAQSGTLVIPGSAKDINLRWKLRLWDSDDVAGPESQYQLFFVTDPPAPTITAPLNDEVLTTGIPQVSWSTGIGGVKVQARYRVLVTQGSNVLYNSNWVDSMETSHGIPVGVLANDQQYTFRVEIQDNFSLQGFDEINVSTDWVEPSGPADTWEVYVHEYPDKGFVYVTWTDENMDADFAGWIVYRRVIGESSWEQVAVVTTGSGRYALRDYFVASGRTYEYTITQMVDRFGDFVESTPTKVVRITPDADNYWLIDPLVPSDSIPMYQVTADPFREEYEQETYSIIGLGRHVEYGDRLGYAGSLTAQLRDKFRTGMSRENFALDPAMTYRSNEGEMPDVWSQESNGTVGNISFGYTETQNPSPTGKSPFRLRADGMATTAGDWIQLVQTIDGENFPAKMKVAATPVTLSFWVFTSEDNANKAFRVVIDWLDSAGVLQSSVNSGALILPGAAVDSYLPSSSIDALAGNATQLWKRVAFSATVPGTPPAGCRIKIRLEGNSGVGTTAGQLIVGGAQLETGSLSMYADGDQLGYEWSGTRYLSYSFGTGYYTARQQRMALERIKARKTWVFLRNPFGDLWRVAPSDISVTRIPGVGKSEYVDVEMPYQEVEF
jgi:hypothetical protein